MKTLGVSFVRTTRDGSESGLTENRFLGIVNQLKTVARLIRVHSERGLGVNRDVFFVEMGGK